MCELLGPFISIRYSYASTHCCCVFGSFETTIFRLRNPKFISNNQHDINKQLFVLKHNHAFVVIFTV